MLQDVKTALQLHSASLGISAMGIAPWPLPREARDILSHDDVCPFTTESVDDRLSARTALEEVNSAIVCLFSYYQPVPEGCQPNLPRYAWGLDYHIVVPHYLEQLGAYLQELVPEAHYEIHCDTSPLADRYMAYLAGLGFYGKNHCLIHPTLGSYTSIGTILTSVALPPDQPLNQSCLDCRRCETACPGGALRDDGFDYRLCKSYITQCKGDLDEASVAIMRKTPLIFGCDRCQEVCPHNQGLAPTTVAEWAHPEPYLSYEELSSHSNKTFAKTFGQRSFAWRGKGTLVRNFEYIRGERQPVKAEDQDEKQDD